MCGFAYLSAHLVMTGCSSEAVKMPVVIAHQLASGSAQADTRVKYNVEKYNLQKQINTSCISPVRQ